MLYILFSIVFFRIIILAEGFIKNMLKKYYFFNNSNKRFIFAGSNIIMV